MKAVTWIELQPALEKLWLEGKSSSVIAAALGHGITRNAVIGKVHRLKLREKHPWSNGALRANPIERKLWTPGMPKVKLSPHADGDDVVAEKPRRHAKAPLRRKPVDTAQTTRLEKRLAFPLPSPPKNPLDAFADGYHGQKGRIGLVDLESWHCRFPVDMPDGAVHYCGLTREDGGSYCPEHAARCNDGVVHRAPQPFKFQNFGGVRR
jgi:GcrA cell cycle regulator